MKSSTSSTNWFKAFIFISIFFGLSIYLYSNLFISVSTQNPVSSDYNYDQKLRHALTVSQFGLSSEFTINPFLQQCRLNLQDSTQVILSTAQDPYYQIVALQQLQKAAKIRGLKFSTIDLSLSHPYASL